MGPIVFRHIRLDYKIYFFFFIFVFVDVINIIDPTDPGCLLQIIYQTSLPWNTLFPC